MVTQRIRERCSLPAYDAIVVGSGPNGLSAAVELARSGRSVLVLEAGDSIGGGCRSVELTLPRFVHDVCAAIHPTGVASPFFRSLPLDRFGLEWIHPDAPLVHPLAAGDSVVVERSLEETARGLGRDAARYRRLLQPFVEHWEDLLPSLLGPPLRAPHHPLLIARYGGVGVWPVTELARALFREERTRALLAGCAAHAMLPLNYGFTSALGLALLVLAHSTGWPVARGGSGAIVHALGAYFQSLGGEILTNAEVGHLDELPPASSVLFDTTPKGLLGIAGEQLPTHYRAALRRFRYGPAAFKVDWALDGPIPWGDPRCLRAATVHVGGSLEEIARSEQAMWTGPPSPAPFVLLAQQSLFDTGRAPEGGSTVWAYCHVPNGCSTDMTDAIEEQIERSAPGFRERIIGRHVFSPLQYERYNANYVGGDINGGAMTPVQIMGRPTLRFRSYATPHPRLYLCSSSTPPGGGVHGMCGYLAARAVMRG